MRYLAGSDFCENFCLSMLCDVMRTVEVPGRSFVLPDVGITPGFDNGSLAFVFPWPCLLSFAVAGSSATLKEDSLLSFTSTGLKLWPKKMKQYELTFSL